MPLNGCVPLLLTRNYHKTVISYTPKKIKSLKEKKLFAIDIEFAREVNVFTPGYCIFGWWGWRGSGVVRRIQLI